VGDGESEVRVEGPEWPRHPASERGPAPTGSAPTGSAWASSLVWAFAGQVTHCLRQLVEATDERQVLQAIAAAVVAGTRWGASAVAIRDAEGDYHVRAVGGLADADADVERRLRSRSMPASVHARLESVAEPIDRVRVVGPTAPVLRDPEVQACLVPVGSPCPSDCRFVFVPLVAADGEDLGFVSVAAPRQEGAICPAEAVALGAFADQAVLALQLARARAAERSQQFMANGLLRAAAAVRSSLDLDEVLHDVARAMVATGGFRRVAVYLLDGDGALRLAATAGLSGEEASRLARSLVRLEDFQHLMRPEMRVSRSYLFDHRYFDLPPAVLARLSVPDSRERAEGEWHPLDSLTVPMSSSSGKLVGLISADEPWDGGFPDIAHIQAIEFFADQAAVAIVQASTHQAAERAARSDPLTGVPNRRGFREALVRTLAGSAGAPCSLLFVDLDHFKRVNDTWRHAVGDRVLVAVADALVAGVREDDVVARFGGEEFVVLLGHTPAYVAAQLAERLRERVADLVIPLAGGVTVTVSIGVAEVVYLAGEAPETVAERLIDAADAAMYAAKRQGRNRVVVAPEASGSGPGWAFGPSVRSSADRTGEETGSSDGRAVSEPSALRAEWGQWSGRGASGPTA
jgi:diguanylate cyclase (GGDEF)-like protein